jgi:hypothetical protein
VSRYQDGLRIPTTIFEAAALRGAVKVWCSRCSNSVVFEAAGLWWRFRCRGWEDHFDLARRRFFCVKCAVAGSPGIRPRKLEAVRERPSRAILPDPPDREWKREIRRFRT